MSNLAVKSILGVVAAGGFALSFGQESISQYLPFTSSSNNATCLKQFYREQPPFLIKEKLQKDTYPLCFNGFNVMYSGVSKTPLWTAEYLSVSRLSQKIKREDSFHEELQVNAKHRASLSDYKGSGYDRGHMSPNADMPTKEAQFDSFSLANMVPQAPKNNQQIWRELEEATRAIVTKQKQDVYLVTGPVFSGKKVKTIGNGVIVPTAVFKAVYLPKNGIVGVYYAPNNNLLQVKVISVCELEEMVGINVFPQLTAEQKRNTYQLPLKATEVKANKTIEYSHWDAESQCAEDIPSDQIKALQKKFIAPSSMANVSTTTSTNSTTSSQTGANQNSSSSDDRSSSPQEQVIESLLEALLKFLMSFFK